jgi:hypothetical protein
MNNTIIFLLSVLDVISDLIELTYDLGVFTRKYILPAVLFVIVGLHFYSNKLWDTLTSQEYTITVCKTPLTTGLSLG